MNIPITLRTDFDAAAVRRVAKATGNAAQGRPLLALLGQAGWHGSTKLIVPANITFLPLPPRSPE